MRKEFNLLKKYIKMGTMKYNIKNKINILGWRGKVW